MIYLYTTFYEWGKTYKAKNRAFNSDFTGLVNIKYNMFVQSDWLARKFRDCNGESNGLALPPTVLQEEKFCDGNTSQSSQLQLVRRISLTSSDCLVVGQHHRQDHHHHHHAQVLPGRLLQG